MQKKILYLTIIFFFLSNLGLAQDIDLPFESIQIGANYNKNLNKNEFHKYWNSIDGIGVYFQTPFYYGFIKFGLNYANCKSITNEQPNFTNILAYADWGKKFSLPLNLGLSLFFRIGISQMDFEPCSIIVNKGFLTERELLVGTGINLSFNLNERLKLCAGLDYEKTFTYKRIELYFFQIGLGYEFESPGWLKDFLK